MITMLKRHEIQVLLAAGLASSKVEELTGVTQRTVQRIAKEPPVDHVSDSQERRRRGIGRPGKVKAMQPLVERCLAEDPAMLTIEILRRARLDGYTGSKSPFFALVARLRPKDQKPVVRFEGLAGEFSQHDFGQVDVRFVDGSERRVHFFASRLKYSRTVAVSLVPDERSETLVRALVRHFASFGGLPLLAVFDRPKTVAVKWDKSGKVTEWNAVFSSVVLELGLGVELCWPYSPQQKGSVENLVGFVKGSFFKPRRFLDLEDLARQLAEWTIEVNEVRPSRATGVIPKERLAEERARLRPLRVMPDELAIRVPVRIGPTGVVTYEGAQYSMPADALGLPATLFLFEDKVRIVAGRHEVDHPRLRGSGAKSLLPEHRAAAVAAVSGRRGKRYLEREHLLALGSVALDFLTELVHRRPSRWTSDVERLHGLLGQVGEDAMRSAMALANSNQTIGAEYVAHYLEHELTNRMEDLTWNHA